YRNKGRVGRRGQSAAGFFVVGFLAAADFVAVVFAAVAFAAVVFAAVDLAAVDLAAGFFAAGFFAAVRFFAGPAARLSARSSTACSNVTDSIGASFGSVRFVSPSVTYGPKRPSLMTIGLPLVGSSPSSRSG